LNTSPCLPSIPILFENDDLIAVNKPEGLASIPERAREKECALSLLSSLSHRKLYIVHRLDKETSGVLIFAKNAAAHKCLNQQFSRREIKKMYVALTHGEIPENSGIIDKPLRQFGSGRVGVDAQNGKSSATEFKVTRRFRDYTLVSVRPSTGRRHQIRSHLYSIGHPIVGDLLYGDKALQQKFPRLMLHAQKITLHLPSSEIVTIEALIPDPFKAVIDAISL
jgi:RluA family pseudouridine synthase